MSSRSVQNVPTVAWYAAAGIALVCAGCIPAPGADNAFYVLIPYAIALVCLVRAAMLHVRIARNDAPSRREDTATRPDRLRAWLLVGMVCSVCAAVGEVVHLLRVGPSAGFGYAAATTGSTGWQQVAWMLAYVILVMLAGACMYLLRRRLPAAADAA